MHTHGLIKEFSPIVGDLFAHSSVSYVLLIFIIIRQLIYLYDLFQRCISILLPSQFCCEKKLIGKHSFTVFVNEMNSEGQILVRVLCCG